MTGPCPGTHRESCAVRSGWAMGTSPNTRVRPWWMPLLTCCEPAMRSQFEVSRCGVRNGELSRPTSSDPARAVPESVRCPMECGRACHSRFADQSSPQSSNTFPANTEGNPDSRLGNELSRTHGSRDRGHALIPIGMSCVRLGARLGHPRRTLESDLGGGRRGGTVARELVNRSEIINELIDVEGELVCHSLSPVTAIRNDSANYFRMRLGTFGVE